MKSNIEWSKVRAFQSKTFFYDSSSQLAISDFLYKQHYSEISRVLSGNERLEFFAETNGWMFFLFFFYVDLSFFLNKFTLRKQFLAKRDREGQEFAGNKEAGGLPATQRRRCALLKKFRNCSLSGFFCTCILHL